MRTSPPTPAATGAAAMSFFATGLQPPTLRAVDMIAAAPAPSEPVVVYTGPTRTGAAYRRRREADAARDAPPTAKKRSKTAHSKRDGNAAPRSRPTPAADPKSKHRLSVTHQTRQAAKPAGQVTSRIGAKPRAPTPSRSRPAKPAKPKPAARPRASQADRTPAPAAPGARRLDASAPGPTADKSAAQTRSCVAMRRYRAAACLGQPPCSILP